MVLEIGTCVERFRHSLGYFCFLRACNCITVHYLPIIFFFSFYCLPFPLAIIGFLGEQRTAGFIIVFTVVNGISLNSNHKFISGVLQAVAAER